MAKRSTESLEQIQNTDEETVKDINKYSIITEKYSWKKISTGKGGKAKSQRTEKD